jgi:hypothetical protein
MGGLKPSVGSDSAEATAAPTRMAVPQQAHESNGSSDLGGLGLFISVAVPQDPPERIGMPELKGVVWSASESSSG